MLAHNKDYAIDDLIYPLYASVKLDGIRCLKPSKESVVSRSFKPTANRHIRKILTDILPVGADGEIMTGETFQDVSSDVMTFGGAPKFKYFMFDYVTDSLTKPYVERVEDMVNWYYQQDQYTKNIVWLVTPIKVTDKAELLRYEQDALDQGYEGLILRSGNSPYKCGRATFKEHYMLKLKRFVDAEAIIVGFEEMYINDNPQELDAFGLAKRSSCQANLIPAGMLGAWVVEDCKTKEVFKIGSGFTERMKIDFWNNREKLLGSMVTYKYFPVGVKDKPRLPIFKGIRSKDDMGG